MRPRVYFVREVDVDLVNLIQVRASVDIFKMVTSNQQSH